MRANLDLTGGAIMAEAVMMALAPSIGHEQAHAAVSAASRRAARNGSDLRTALLADPELAASFQRGELDQLLDPAEYLGLAVETARSVADTPTEAELR
jgi:3-carboxy-cis,cis-muconate cycloisomerase